MTWDECAARWNLSVNAVRGRAKTLQIPIAYIDRVAHWPGELIEFGDAFNEWREQFTLTRRSRCSWRRLVLLLLIRPRTRSTGSLVKKGDAERAAELMVAGMKSMASELKILQKDDTPPPLLRAKLLAEIADNKLIVSKEELKAIGVIGIPNAGLGFRQHGYDFTGYYAIGGERQLRAVLDLPANGVEQQGSSPSSAVHWTDCWLRRRGADSSDVQLQPACVAALALIP